MGDSWAPKWIPPATPEEDAAREARQWLQPDDGPASPPPRVEREYTLPPGFLDPFPLHPLDPYNYPGPEEEEPEEEEPEEGEPEEEGEEEEEDSEEDPEEEQEENDFDPPGYDINSEEEESETDDVDDAMVIDPAFPVRSMYEPTPTSFAAHRHSDRPVWRHTPRQSVPPVTSANAPTLPFPAIWPAREREWHLRGPSPGEEGESSRPIPLPANTGGPISGSMALMRDRLSRLEAQATSSDGELGHLRALAYTQGVGIKVLRQSVEMCEAALAATRAALAATQAELDILKSKEDRKQKGPAA